MCTCLEKHTKRTASYNFGRSLGAGAGGVKLNFVHMVYIFGENNAVTMATCKRTCIEGAGLK